MAKQQAHPEATQGPDPYFKEVRRHSFGGNSKFINLDKLKEEALFRQSFGSPTVVHVHKYGEMCEGATHFVYKTQQEEI